MEYKNLKKTFLAIGVTRIATIASNFIITSLLLKILGVESYGVYTAMFSLMTWMFLFDIGISKGMRNHLTIAMVENQLLKARQLISTAYITTGLISLSFLGLILFLTWNFDLAKFLNIVYYSSEEVFFVYVIFMSIMFAKLVFGTINQILYAKHKSSINAINVLAINLIYIVFLTVCIFFEYKSLILISICYGVSIIASYLIITTLFFLKNKELIPSFNFYSKNLIKLIMGDGLQILVIQLLFFTFLGLDRFILLKYASSTEVTNYDIMYKVMSLLLFPWSIIAQPLWSSYAEAYRRKDIDWIKKVYKRLIIFFLIVMFGVLFLSVSFDYITLLWINIKLNVSFQMLLLAGLLILTIMWSTMHSDMLFGLSKFKIPLITSFLGLLVKVAIIGWALNTNFSISSLLISSILAYAIFCILAPIKVFKILKEG